MKDLCLGCRNTQNICASWANAKLIFFVLFIWCAIFLQTTEAVPVRRVSTSGRKLILHTNVHRERYHQKLLEEQRQQQLQIQQQLQEQQQQQRQLHQLQQLQKQLQQLQQAQPQTHHSHSHPTQHHQQQQQAQPLQQQLQHQVQKNHLFSPIHQTRRHSQQLPHHRHHLHQRAVQSHKMSSCDSMENYEILQQQINASLSTIKNILTRYLKYRGNKTFEGMSETWKLIDLHTRIPNYQPESDSGNKMHEEIRNFYANLKNFFDLINYVRADTEQNKPNIIHVEELDSTNNITDFFVEATREVEFILNEADHLMKKLNIQKPDLMPADTDFGRNLSRPTRDFIIFKKLIEELERVLRLLENCTKNNAEG